jgi:two-component system, NarL family, sensor kinase
MKFLFFFTVFYSALGLKAQNFNSPDSLLMQIKTSTHTLTKAKAYMHLFSFYEKKNLNKAKLFLDTAKLLSNTTNNDTLLINLNNKYAAYFFDIGQPDSAKLYASQSLKGAYKLRLNVAAATSLGLLAGAYSLKNDFKNAHLNYLKSIKIYAVLNNQFAIGNAYINIGNLFQHQGIVAQAEKYYALAGIIFTKLNDNERKAQLYNNYGILYGENNELLKSEKYFEASTHIREKLTDQLNLANSYLNLGGINVLLKNYTKAEVFLKKSMLRFKAINNQYGQASCLTNLGQLNEETHNYTQAIAYYEQSIALSKTNNNMEDLENSLINISNVYQKKGNYKQAFLYNEELINLKDTIYKKSLTSQIAEMQIKYETDKKEQNIKLLHKENKIQKLIVAKRNTYLVLTLGALLSTILLGLLFYNRYKLKQETRLQSEIIKQQDLATKAVLEAEEKERKRIAGDLHDGIGQLFSVVKINLSGLLARIQLSNMDDKLLAEKTIALVDESCKEVRSISHQMMPNVLLKSGLASAIKDFIEKIDKESLRVNLHTVGLNTRLASNIEIVFYRVLQEAVNNVIKHANASQLDIQLVKDGESITATVEDNGIGFDKNLLEKFEGIGLKNIRTRIEYLKGTVDFDTRPYCGTAISIWIPLC